MQRFSYTAQATMLALAIWVAVFIVIILAIPEVGPVSPWLIWIYLGIAYFIFSFRFWDPVKETDRAARIFFGRDAGDVGPGPVFAPLLLVQVVPVKVSITQREFPGEPNTVYRGNLNDPTINLTGKVLPIRIPFRESISDEDAKAQFGDDYIVTTQDGTKITFLAAVTNDGLSSRITAELYMVVRFTPKNIYRFIRNIGDIDEAVKQIEDEMVTTATQYLGRMSYAQAIANIRWLNIILYRAVARRIGAADEDSANSDHAWGVELHDVRVKNIELDHTTNESIRDAASARFGATKTVTAAQAEKQKRVLEGEGAAHAARNLQEQILVGRAAGSKKMMEDLGVGGREIINAEVARAIAEGGNTTIFGADGMAQIATLLGTMVNKQPAPEKKGAETE